MSFSISPEIAAVITEAIDITHDPIAVFDPNDTIVFCNPAFVRQIDIPVANPVGLTFTELMKICFDSERGFAIDSNNFDEWITYALGKRRSIPFRTFDTDLNNGKWLRVSELIVDDHVFMYATDLSSTKELEIELKNTQEQLRELASTDFLTGAYNRRYFYKFASSELERCERSNLHATLAIIDLDYFKNVNDKYGHSVGDGVLIEFCNRVAACLRPYDILARIGGEEFAVLLPETTTESAIQVAKRYQSAITNSPFVIDEHVIPVTCSIGLSESYPDIKTLDYLLKNADDNLYLAKRQGRNTIVSPN